MILNGLIVILTVLIMEAFAWFSHKFILHGFLWNIHQSHHTNEKKLFEKNDIFGVVFGLVSTLFIIIGSKYNYLNWLFFIGIGILIYGLFYFLFHDIIVHQRIRFKFTTKNKYLKRIIKAHNIHHKTHVKNGAEAFGFLYAAKKYKSKLD